MMLVQSSLPNSLNTNLAFQSDHGKGPDMDLVHGWAHCTEHGQKCSRCEQFSGVICRQFASIMDKIDRIVESETPIQSKTISDSSTVSIMCVASGVERNKLVYKRRKLRKHIVANLSAHTTEESMNSGSEHLSGLCAESLDGDGCLKPITNLHSQNRTVNLEFVSKLDSPVKSSIGAERNIVYKRRKLLKNIVANISAHTTAESTKSGSEHLSNLCAESLDGDGCLKPTTNLHSQHRTVNLEFISELDSPLKSSIGAKRNKLVYKRRKLCKHIVANLSADTRAESMKSRYEHLSSLCAESLDGDGCLKPITNLHSQNRTVNLAFISELDSPVKRSTGADQGFSSVDLVSHVKKSAPDNDSSANDSCSSSKLNIENDATTMKADVGDTGECSSSDIPMELFRDGNSAKESCIFILKKHGLLEEDQRSGVLPTVKVDCTNDANCLQSCKVCGIQDNRQTMLICDLCDEAFHMACCNTRVKSVLVNEWYCRTCFQKRPITLYENTATKRSNASGGVSERIKKPCQSRIKSMLKDTDPYTSVVRIGIDFQAEVPEWTGPVGSNFDAFCEPIEVNAAECDGLNGCNSKKLSAFIGNWVQCREENEGIVCRKWRRVPLSVVQTDDWDCSCAVIWDPIHADCAVPQELETSEIQKHLKYVQLLRPRLAKKNQNPSQTKNI
ncbi:Methyl-CpG-binding domain-containing protein 9 [Acorus gramineus]|uniref:Methyl-CpG-binding domain-containing protein 9 n=1 Tax=Acorus gramineus TaxID=55184 RepID=A0AAV9BF91_ACOGR|nr:Methyl-CpG-binding domain-containing protein 9 [Acorus gramineus]